MKKTNNLNLSLVIPCYNEELNIQKGVLDKIGNFTQPDKRFREVIIVDDGSDDSTVKVIKQKYLKRFSKFRLIENKHKGKAFAVITGIRQAKSEFVMFSDIDLATPIEESEKLISKFQQAPIIIGSRSKTRTGAPVTRKLMAVGFIFIRNLLIGLRGIRDTQCGFKLFDRNVALEVINRLVLFHEGKVIEGSYVSAGFDLEFLFLARKLKYKIIEVPVTWHHVETKNVNFIKDSLETLRELLKIKLYDLKGFYQRGE